MEQDQHIGSEVLAAVLRGKHCGELVERGELVPTRGSTRIVRDLHGKGYPRLSKRCPKVARIEGVHRVTVVGQE